MKDNKDHIDFERDFFKKASIGYSKSKEDVWLDMESKMSKKPQGRLVKLGSVKIIQYSAAAILIIGLGLFSFLRLYSEKTYCPNGQHLKFELPDGSMVTLNANSEISYHPYWWQYSRILEFKGEAFFEVKKGKKFKVNSEQGSTTVLGTKFNIYSRNNDYKVYCIQGRVKVEDNHNDSVILTKNEFSIVNQKTKMTKLQDENSNKNAIAWIDNKFIFTAMPLKEVYEEIERQFDITIDGKENLIGISTSGATRGSSPEEIINLIGKPFGVKCMKISDKKYIVEQK